MPEPFLIAHLVRGEPAFDIAIKLQIGDEEGWIIPTSGHRAYPYWHQSLKDMALTDSITVWEDGAYSYISPYTNSDHPSKFPTVNWPDHYAPSAAPRGQGLISNLAERLGLIPKPHTITRR